MIGTFHESLLYEIDAIFLWSDGGHSLEVAVQVTLIEKAAFNGRIGNILSFTEIPSCQMDAAVHPVGVRSYAGFSLEFPE